MVNFVIINMKSRMKGDFHVWFCGNAGVKFPCVTRLDDTHERATERLDCVAKVVILIK